MVERKRRKGFLERIKEAGVKEEEGKEEVKNRETSSYMPPPPTNNFVKDNKILRAYRYAETHRMRERIVNAMIQRNAKACVITSPSDGVGNTFLTCILALNTAFFTSMKVLIVDANLRKPEFHNIFEVENEIGIIDVIYREAKPKEVIKRMPYDNFFVVTAGVFRDEISKYINRNILKYFVDEVKNDFDIIYFDTSPVLINNRNNIDPSVLANICDITFFTILDCKTTKVELRKMVDTVGQAGGKIGGILYNRYLSPSKLSLSYLLNLLGFSKKKMKFAEMMISF